MIPPRDLARPQTVAEEGWCAFYDSKDRRHCPYDTETLRRWWMEGYDAAEEWFARE